MFPCTTSNSLCSLPSWSELNTITWACVGAVLFAVTTGEPWGGTCGPGEIGSTVTAGRPTAMSASGILWKLYTET